MSRLMQAVEAVPSRLEDVALAVAADEYGEAAAVQVRGELDRLAEPLRSPEPAAAELAPLALLCRRVYGELGFAGSDDYDDPRDNFLNDVLERRRGSPVCLAVVLVALGRRVGLPLEPVSFPGHFLVRVGHEQPTYVDPCDGGHPIEQTALLRLAQQTLECGEQQAAERLEPVGPRTVAVRILQNLQQIYTGRGDHPRLLVVANRLFELTGAPCHLCDRGAHALASGAARLALSDLQAYLDLSPQAPDAAQVRRVVERLRQLEFEPPC